MLFYTGDDRVLDNHEDARQTKIRVAGHNSVSILARPRLGWNKKTKKDRNLVQKAR